MNRQSLVDNHVLKVIIFFFSFFIFSYNLSNIKGYAFDEIFYVPAAKEWIKMSPKTNTEHPPLGKYLIAASIKCFGDNPVGWRASAVISGSFAILLCFLISSLVFKDFILSVTIFFFTLFNFFLYVQSRIAMLDIFMVTFLLAGIYYFLKYKDRQKDNISFYLSSFFMGLAVAIKWSAIFIYLPFFIMVTASEIRKKDSLLKVLQRFGLFGFFSIGSYFLTYVPFMFITTAKFSIIDIIFVIPGHMLEELNSVSGGNVSASAWYSWPFAFGPLSYAKDSTANDFNIVLLVGNFLQLIVGFMSVCYLFLRWFKIQLLSKATLVIFLCSWLSWGLVTRKLFYLHYFFPSAMCYSFLVPMALREAFDHKKATKIMIAITVLSSGFFLYFFPLLSGNTTSYNSLFSKLYDSEWMIYLFK